MSGKQQPKPPPWMTEEEWREWEAGSNARSRRLYELAKKGQEEREAREREREAREREREAREREAEERRARRRRFLFFR